MTLEDKTVAHIRISELEERVKELESSSLNRLEALERRVLLLEANAKATDETDDFETKDSERDW